MASGDHVVSASASGSTMNYNDFVLQLLSGNSPCVNSQDIVQAPSNCQSQSLVNEEEFDKEIFLNAVRRYKCLWDTSDPLVQE